MKVKSLPSTALSALALGLDYRSAPPLARIRHQAVRELCSGSQRLWACALALRGSCILQEVAMFMRAPADGSDCETVPSS
jgi:hypothetical protein